MSLQQRLGFYKLAITCLMAGIALQAQALAQKPELFVQTGHTSVVFAVAFASNDLLASCSADHSIRLWDLKTNRELRTLRGHTESVFSVSLSSNGQMLASGSMDKTIRLWDVQTGKELHVLRGHWQPVRSVAFSLDGKLLASGGFDNAVKIWDVASGTEVRTIRGHDGFINSVAFNPNRTMLASGDENHTIKVWDLSNGNEIRTLGRRTDGVSQLITDLQIQVSSVVFSADGRTLAGATSNNVVKLWDIATGRELKTFVGHGAEISALTFSPDGQALATASIDRTIKLWDVRTGRVRRTYPANSKAIYSIQFSPDGRTLATGDFDRVVKRWDVASGKFVGELRGNVGSVSALAFSPDGQTFASGGGDKTIKLWDARSGKLLRSFSGHTQSVTSLTFSPNGKTIASGSLDKTIKIWDLSTGTELRQFPVQPQWVSEVAFSPDGRTIASAVNNLITLWDAEKGVKLRTLHGHASTIYSIAFRPDGRVLASGSEDTNVQLWDVATGEQIRTIFGRGRPGYDPATHSVISETVYTIAFTDDGSTLATGGAANVIKLWDVATGERLKTLPGHGGGVRSLAFSHDGRTLASGGYDNLVILWDLKSGERVGSLSGHTSLINSLGFTDDDGVLLSGSGDGKIKVWHVPSGVELCTVIGMDHGDWLVVTPDGLFDGTPAAWNDALWRFSETLHDVAPVETYFNEFFYPDLLADVFAGQQPKAPSDISQKDRRQPEINLALADSQTPGTLGTRTATLIVHVSEVAAGKGNKKGSGAQDVRLFRNGSLVKVWRGDVLKNQSSVTLDATVSVVAGENRFTAYVFNHDNIKSSDATLVIDGATTLKRQGTTYIIAIGVNEYANKDYNLRYAVADAQDFGAEISRQQEALKQYEKVQVISLYDKDAVKENILLALMLLSGRGALPTNVPESLKKLQKAEPEDLVMLYFAGHGTAHENQFFLIPHDLGYDGSEQFPKEEVLKLVLANSISDRDLQDAFEKVDAGRLLLVIDACNSGQALEAEEKRRGPMNSKGLAQLAYEKGMYILTAAQSYQAAKESSELGHGLLTFALIEEGLKQAKAEKNQRGEITERSWLDYATRRVPEKQIEKMKQRALEILRGETGTAEEGSRSSELVFKEGDNKNVAPEKRAVQRPRVFYRQELETQPLIVARP